MCFQNREELPQAKCNSTPDLNFIRYYYPNTYIICIFASCREQFDKFKMTGYRPVKDGDKYQKQFKNSNIEIFAYSLTPYIGDRSAIFKIKKPKEKSNKESTKKSK